MTKQLYHLANIRELLIEGFDDHTFRSYYPDFLFQKQDGSYVIVEVKRADMIEDAVVQAKKDFAQQMAIASGMTYHIISGHDCNKGNYHFLLEGDSKSKTTRQQRMALD